MNTDIYQTKLETELATLTKELSTIAQLNEFTGDWVAVPEGEDLAVADLNLEADGAEEWHTRRALMVQLETRYKNITRALEKISAGTYGICEISGDPIEPKRLEANPAARTNIANRNKEDELTL